MTLRARRLTLWIASLAILLAALGPGLSALAAGTGSTPAPWHEVCTASGLFTPTTDESAPAPGGQNLPGKHCPWCTHHIGFALPPAVAQVALFTPSVQLVVRPPARPLLRGTPPHQLAAPRGPPLHS